ncbi:hypothetical protein C9927_00045 [Pseudidiomarina aestuarii]|uniref:Cellulose synthase operon C C-terminal domain-containing protein n=1 Tax=Pseudidiomarina aestuarii TaxID=624146 RepID=A0A2T4D9J2_9GAMM|nr:hypothetical protein C9940_03640 [Pseudidiomarina aestuarii]PTB90394.1 hypothetical protein C9928_00380 [Pseudidiomarina aestuarii]PTB90473.1 hypothetical protein C9927_00045 [Pseudidiomarina aestuarii]
MLIRTTSRLKLLTLCVIVTLSTASAASQDFRSLSEDPATRLSLQLVEERVRLWVDRGREYRLEDAFAQLRRIVPEHPLILELEANAALQQGNVEVAKTNLARLQEIAPEHQATMRLAELLLISTEHQQALSEVRLLNVAGRAEEAWDKIQTVFEEPPKNIEWAIEYWSIVGQVVDRQRAIEGLNRLLDSYPEHIPTRLALYNQKLAADQLTTTDLLKLNELTLDPIYSSAALSLWSRIIMNMPANPSNRFVTGKLAQLHPKHAEINRHADRIQSSPDVLVAAEEVSEISEQVAGEINASELESELQTVVAQTSEGISETEAVEEPALPNPWDVADAANTLEENGEIEAARDLYLTLISENPEEDSYFAYALFLERISEYAEAQRQLDQLPPDESGAGVIALQQRLIDRRLAGVQNVRSITVDGESISIPNATSLGDLSEQREAIFWFGFDKAERESTPGISTWNTDSYIARLSLPMESDPTGEWFIQVDSIHADAGALDADDTFWRNRFGTGLLCETGCPEGIQPQLYERGTSLGAGARWGQWELDFGVSPIGFNDFLWLGGISYSGDLGEFGWGVEAQRRAITTGVISFAGADDPYSNRSWGPVARNNLGFSFNWDQGGGWGWWSNIGINWFNGRELKSNRQWYAYSGLYWTPFDTEPFAIDVGLTGLSWGYENDQSQSTFGQGSYYSPKRYVSASIPITFYGRYKRLSYRLRASFGKSSTDLSASQFFPNNPELQEQAIALIPQSDINPIFEGGSGGGFGKSFSASLEYQINSHWYVGFSASLERSEFYTPDNFALYLRYHFGGWSLPARRPPAPPQRYVDNPWFE